MIQTLLLVLLVVAGCVTLMGVGVFFFGKNGFRSECGSVPVPKNEDCPSQKAGMCPVENPSEEMKLAKRSRILYHK